MQKNVCSIIANETILNLQILCVCVSAHLRAHEFSEQNWAMYDNFCPT